MNTNKNLIIFELLTTMCIFLFVTHWHIYLMLIQQKIMLITDTVLVGPGLSFLIINQFKKNTYSKFRKTKCSNCQRPLNPSLG